MLKRGVGKALVVLATLVSLIQLAPSASALDSKARIVRLSYAEGNVQAERGQGQGYDKAVMNMPITEGMRLWTNGDNAYAEVELEDGSSIRLAPDTMVEFRELGLRASGERISGIELSQGTAYVDLRGHVGQFRLISAGQEFTADRNSHFRIEGGKEQLKVAVYNGDVHAHSGAYDVKIKKNETFTLDLNDASRYYLAKGIGEDQFDGFDQQREEYRTTYSNNTLAYNGYSSNYQYGLSDLSYYGSYFYAPGWGYLWRPFGMGIGWNPFMDGAWMWYPGYGYLWISSYPWGWMPYRYGAWNFFPGYGWCWAPATSWNTWSSFTPVRRPPPHGYVPLRPPTTPPTAASRGIVEVGHGATTLFPPAAGRPGSTMGFTRTAVPGRVMMPPTGAAGSMVAPTGVLPRGMPTGGARVSGEGGARTGVVSHGSVSSGTTGMGAGHLSGGVHVSGMGGHVGGASGGRR